jgi:hypothetical protein
LCWFNNLDGDCRAPCQLEPDQLGVPVDLHPRQKQILDEGLDFRNVNVVNLGDGVEIEVAAVRELVVQFTAPHDELHEVFVFEINLEGQKSDQLRNIILYVLSDHRSVDLVQPLVLETLVDLVSEVLAFLSQGVELLHEIHCGHFKQRAALWIFAGDLHSFCCYVGGHVLTGVDHSPAITLN